MEHQGLNVYRFSLEWARNEPEPEQFSIAILDDQAAGDPGLRDARRERYYGPWLRAARGDDFVGIQTYERAVWSDKDKFPPPTDARRNTMGAEVYPPSAIATGRWSTSSNGCSAIACISDCMSLIARRSPANPRQAHCCLAISPGEIRFECLAKSPSRPRPLSGCSQVHPRADTAQLRATCQPGSPWQGRWFLNPATSRAATSA